MLSGAMHTLLFCSLLACAGSDGSTTGAAGDGGVADDGGTTDAGGGSDGGATDGAAPDGGATATLHGSPPDKALPAPDFAALNMDGAARDREDLLGQPTVMWFYPKAGTAG